MYAVLNASIALILLVAKLDALLKLFALKLFSNAACAVIFVAVATVSLNVTVCPSMINVLVALPTKLGLLTVPVLTTSL